ncbi:hypothetical protein [Allomuricauda sp. SCSIO 65647]|uniref:hypothetical protein n=1 Tax=Allomuricauda sp. SCSIO 65647 TaxID=2908843 RepID=UPI001F2C3488|nr:hypothetical protein [Muricauda sp. SCSIO 65647]UJH68553.1 hypothetical protein L0P89_04915 [Muricauda sp. SCSIO 65647]
MKVKSAFLIGLALVSMTSFLPVSIDGQVAPDSSLQSLELNTDGLYYAEFFDHIFRGHFEQLDMTREDLQFIMIFEQYLRAFGRQCPDVLPADKVEIMEQVCAMEEVTTNGYGVETSRVCVQWKTVGTGLYARPELYSAKLAVERLQSSDALRKTLGMVADPNALGNSVDLMHKAKGLKNDMAIIFRLNPCRSQAIRRFEKNLNLFALNKPAIRMQEASKYVKMKKSGGPSGSQNFNKLVDDLVTDQARTWGFNRYLPGSISNVKEYRDNSGRAKELMANYRYKGFGGTSTGSVRITFTNGLPKCIYFFDFPNNCKSPNSGILASYAKGDYTK